MSRDPRDGFRGDPDRQQPERRREATPDDYDLERAPPRRRQPPSGGGGGGALKVIFIVLGVVLLVTLLCGGGLVGLMFYSVGKVRNAATRITAQNNMKQMGLAMHNLNDSQGHLVASLPAKDGKPGLSWRVAILPYIEQENLYRQFKLDEPWDSPNNIKLLDQMPYVYRNPRLPHPLNQTGYRIFVGNGAMFEHGKKTLLNVGGKKAPDEIQVGDGLSNTIMIVEGTDSVPWTKPDEFVFQPNGALPSFGPTGDPVFMVLLADGSTKAIPVGTLANLIKDAITANGGEKTILP